MLALVVLKLNRDELIEIRQIGACHRELRLVLSALEGMNTLELYLIFV